MTASTLLDRHASAWIRPSSTLSGSLPTFLVWQARFSMDKAEQHPQWLVEAREHEHTPETVEYERRALRHRCYARPTYGRRALLRRYGISSFVFRARRPFHPERLYATLNEARPRPGALAGLLRLKGFAWLATQPNQQAHAALAGTQFTMSPGPPWWAAIPRRVWPPELGPMFEEEARLEMRSPRSTST